jgi:predicted GIY-YIG superfamily endonuclease
MKDSIHVSKDKIWFNSPKKQRIKFSKKQRVNFRELAINAEVPTIDDIFRLYPRFSEEKSVAALNEVKKIRKEFARVLGLTDVKGIQSPKLFGYVYLIVNENYSGWVKCGMTGNVEKRLSQYNTYDPFGKFVVLEAKSVEDRKKAEIKLISELKIASARYKGEWFEIDKEKAIAIFKNS